MPFPTSVLRSKGYAEYKSVHGPKYHKQPSLYGFTIRQWFGVGVKAGAFGGVALFAVIFFASGIPRLQRDVLQKIPIVGPVFVKEPVPASDNPF